MRSSQASSVNRAVPRRAGQPRRRRGSLTPDQILLAAEVLVERHGLEQLTMPAVAAEIGAATTSVYWHFRTRDDLVVALGEMVATRVHARLPEVDESRPWDEQALDYFTALRGELLKHPIYLILFTTRPRFLVSRAKLTSSILRRLEQEVGLFTRTGLTPVESAHAYMACSTYTRGFCLLEYGLTHEVPPTDSGVEDVMSGLDPSAFPVLSALPEFEPLMWLDDDQFALGLRYVLDGVKARVDAPARGRRSRGRG